jgi:amidase
VQRIARTQGTTAVDYEYATHRRTTLWHIVRRFFEQYEVLLTPTTAVPPFAIGVDFPREIAGRPVSSISVPCGWTRDGLPVGLQIVGRRFADATVLTVAHMFEIACPWTHRRPSL